MGAHSAKCLATWDKQLKKLSRDIRAFCEVEIDDSSADWFEKMRNDLKSRDKTADEYFNSSLLRSGTEVVLARLKGFVERANEIRKG